MYRQGYGSSPICSGQLAGRRLVDGPSGEVATEEPVDTPRADYLGRPHVVESAGLHVGSRRGQLAKYVLQPKEWLMDLFS